jgi:hypothetical protein
MLVHLIASLHDPKVDSEYLRQIIEIIHDRGGVLAHSWLEAALRRYEDGISISDWRPYVEANLTAVKRADIVIADLTHYSFSHGYLIAAALQYKKPILAVSRTSLDDKLAGGITDTLFIYKKYSTNEDLARIVRTFIEQNTVHTKDLRFNMFLTRNIFRYLEEKSQETGKNKSEIIRNLIKQNVKDSSSHE